MLRTVRLLQGVSRAASSLSLCVGLFQTLHIDLRLERNISEKRQFLSLNQFIDVKASLTSLESATSLTQFLLTVAAVVLFQFL